MTAPLMKRADAFSQTAIDDEIVLLNLADGTFFSLTGTGAAIWDLIDGTRDRDAVIAALAQAYGTTAAAISDDVDTFLFELGTAGFVD